MPKHRVDIDINGMSHFVNGQFDSATGFPFWENELPDGLHLERRAGRPADKDRKFVRTAGMLAELKEVNTEVNNRQDNREDSIQDRSECRNEKSRSEESRSEESRIEESRIEESRQDRTHKTRDFLMFPMAIAAMTMMHTPGYNMMTPTLEQGLADVKTQAPSRRDNCGIVNDQNYRRHPRGQDGPHPRMREERPGWDRREQMRRETAYGPTSDGDYDEDDEVDEVDDAGSMHDHGIEDELDTIKARELNA
ncbi:MAG: hypothetical protein Q9161_003994 [Pseudevernia consocians]